MSGLALLLALTQLGPATARPSLAVVPISFGDEAPPREQATLLSAALTAQGLQLLPREEVDARLRRERRSSDVDLQALSEAYDLASAGADHGETARALQQIVVVLEDDPAPDQDKTALLQKSRLRLAQALYQRAFFSGDRELSAELQESIFRLLEAAVRADPFVSMPLETYSPEVRRLLDLARRRVARTDKGNLAVRSTPSGASVLLDGRLVGQTPYTAESGVPRGHYRLWLERGACRSRVHEVEVDSASTTVSIDLDFECAIDPAGGALRLGSGELVLDRVAVALGRALQVDRVVLLGEVRGQEGERLFGASYEVSTGQIWRVCALAPGLSTPEGVARLAALLSSEGTRAARAERLSLPLEGGEHETLVPVSAADEPETSPLFWAGVATGGVGLAALVVAAAGFTSFGVGYGALADGAAGAGSDDLDGSYQLAKWGWNIGLISGGVTALAGVVGGGLLLLWATGLEAEAE